VADGVADERHAAEDQKSADEPTGGGDEESHERDPAEGVETNGPGRDEHFVEVEWAD
jgi:hypothetical protein